ncbi:hypothetical protein ACMFMF_008964 [Clarireedia jacksonii]
MRPFPQQSPVNAPGTTDYGSRSGDCRVCVKEAEADRKYQAVVADAQKQYDNIAQEAWRKWEIEMKEAKYETETVGLLSLRMSEWILTALQRFRTLTAREEITGTTATISSTEVFDTHLEVGGFSVWSQRIW